MQVHSGIQTQVILGAVNEKNLQRANNAFYIGDILTLRMKVLQIYKDYYPPIVGGIEKHMSLLSQKLSLRGIEVTAIVSNTTNKFEVGSIGNVNIIKVPQWGRMASAPINPTLPFWIRRLGAKHDLLHFHLPNPTSVVSYLMTGMRKPIIATYHSDIVRQRRLRNIYMPFLHYFLKCKVNRIIATSPVYKQNSRLLRRFSGKCSVIPLGIETESFEEKPNSLQRIKKIKERYKEPIILFVGKFRYYKGLHILVRAMQGVKAKLLLIGSGPIERELRAEVQQLGLNDHVEFIGQVPDGTLIDYFKACDMFVLPSIFKSEAFGIVILEAMACAKPVISTELGTGTTFVNINKKTGLCVAANDVTELRAAMNYLIENPEVKEQLGCNGRIRVNTIFGASTMVDNTIKLYHSILSETQQS